jgi:hypothetical protein
MNNAVFWDVTPCGSYKNCHFGGTYSLDHQETRLKWMDGFLRSMLQMLFTANVPSSLILVTLKMEAIYSSETFPVRRVTQCRIPKDFILQYQKIFIWEKALPVREADNLSAIFEPLPKNV